MLSSPLVVGGDFFGSPGMHAHMQACMHTHAENVMPLAVISQ